MPGRDTVRCVRRRVLAGDQPALLQKRQEVVPVVVQAFRHKRFMGLDMGKIASASSAVGAGLPLAAHHARKLAAM